MKKILYLTFYYEPDLSAGSFRNSSLIKTLSEKVLEMAEVDVYTTMPNRYSKFNIKADGYEQHANCNIFRIEIPKHKSGMRDQVISFKKYFSEVKKMVRDKHYDLVVASSSRLFTAYLGYVLAKERGVPLYLDIRDIFIDTMKDVIKNPILRLCVLPILTIIEKKVFQNASHINLISKGFKPYFAKYPKPKYSFYSNGIDDMFLDLPISNSFNNERIKRITYAGNIGEGQGLEKIVPEAAKRLEGQFEFIIIGDGGAKHKLVDEINKLKVSNVKLLEPLTRNELLKVYSASDFLFIHLNDFDAFKKVLPSKVFELGAFDKPIVAGVGGYAFHFIDENIPNTILFAPANVDELVRKLIKYNYRTIVRKEFINKFSRKKINDELANSIKTYLYI